MKRWQSLLLGLIISVGALYVALRGAHLDRVAEALRTARYGYAVAALVIVAASTYARGLRWSAVLRGRLSPVDATWLFNAGFLFNNVLPFRLGEVVRAYLAARHPPVRFAEALSSIVVERLIDMLNVVAILAILLQFPKLNVPQWAQTAGLLMLIGAAAGIVVLYLAARYPDWVRSFSQRALERLPLPERFTEEGLLGQLESFLEGLASLRDLRAFALALGYSALAWIMSGLSGWILLLAFEDFGAPGIEIGFLAIAAAGLGIAVPSLPAALGPFEAAVKLALVAIGYAQEPALSYALVLHAINFVATSGLGALGLLREGLSFGEVASAAREMGKSEKQPDSEAESVTA
jgi:uncharacterized protein (TIRG00374 family)